MSQAPYAVGYAPPPTNSKSVASMVLGIVSLVIPFIGFVTGPLAVIFAVRSRREIGTSGEAGNGFAITGLVLGIVGCAGYAVILLLIVLGAIAAGASG